MFKAWDISYYIILWDYRFKTFKKNPVNDLHIHNES